MDKINVCCTAVTLKDGPDYHMRVVNGIDFSAAIREPEQVRGRKIFDVVAQALRGHDGGLLPIVATKFPLDDYILRYQRELHEIENALRLLKSLCKMEYFKPARDAIDSQRSAEIYEMMKIKHDEYHSKFIDHRTALTKRTMSAEKGKKSARQAAAAAAEEAEEKIAADQPDKLPEQTFPDSVFFQELQEVIKNETDRITYESNKTFNRLNQTYDNNLATKNKALQDHCDKEVDQKHIELVLKYLYGVKSALEVLANNLKNAMKQCPELLSKVKSNVRVESTKEVLNNPFNMDGLASLSGMFLILYKDFMKPQLQLFTQQVIILDSVHYDQNRC